MVLKGGWPVMDIQGLFDYVGGQPLFWPVVIAVSAFAAGLLIPWGRRSR